MAIDLTIHPSQKFPAGTPLSVYARDAFAGPPPVTGQSPGGASVYTTATVSTTGAATLAALQPDSAYYVGGQVDGEWRWVQVRTPEGEAESVETQIAALEARLNADELAFGTGTRPALTNPGPHTATVGVPTELQLSATSVSSWTADGLPQGLHIDPLAGRISGTPTTAETATVIITAAGSGGTTSAVFTWTVSAAPAPTLSKPADQTGNVGTPVSLQLVATNASVYSATNLPKGVSINTGNGLITGTPTTAEGPLTVTVKASGPGEPAAERTFTWTVSAALTLPAIREGMTEAEGVATSKAAPAVTAGTVVGDLLLLLVKVEHTTALQTVTTPEGWTLVGTRGTISSAGHFASYYVFTAPYTGQAMPTLTASASVEWVIRSLSIQGGGSVEVSAGFNDQAASTTMNIPSVTTAVAKTLVIALLSNNAGATMTLPAGGWTAYNTKLQMRPVYKNLAAAEASGATTSTLSVSTPTTVLTLAVAPPVVVAGIGEQLSPDKEAVEPINLPAGTTSIRVARGTAESGQEENTRTEVVASTTTRIPGTVERPWVALQALNAKGEPIGPETSRLLTAPTLTVPTVQRPPGIPAVTGVVGTRVELQIFATESPTSYSASGLPAGLSINTATGLITGTPTTAASYTTVLTATNAHGTSAPVTFPWNISAAAAAVQTGLVMNSDSTSSPSLAAIALGPASIVRVEFGIGTAASSVKSLAETMASHSTLLQPLAGFSGRLPTATEAKGLAAWASALAPLGVKYIEFGNETNYQVSNNKANGETYGARAKEAAEAIQSTGVKLLVQGSDAGSSSSNMEWLNGVFAAWPGVATHPAFGGWTIHAYPGMSKPAEKDTFGGPMMERMIKRLEEKGDKTSSVFNTEWGSASTAKGTTLSDGSHRTWAEAAKILEEHKAILEATSRKRLVQLLLYQAHDQHAEGETNREYFFGALTNTGGSKGAFTTFAQAFL